LDPVDRSSSVGAYKHRSRPQTDFYCQGEKGLAMHNKVGSARDAIPPGKYNLTATWSTILMHSGQSAPLQTEIGDAAKTVGLADQPLGSKRPGFPPSRFHILGARSRSRSYREVCDLGFGRSLS